MTTRSSTARQWCRRQGFQQAGMWRPGHTSPSETMARSQVSSSLFRTRASPLEYLDGTSPFIEGRPCSHICFKQQACVPSADHVGRMRSLIQRRGPSLPTSQVCDTLLINVPTSDTRGPL